MEPQWGSPLPTHPPCRGAGSQPLLDAQLDLLTPMSMRARRSRSFDPAAVAAALWAMSSARVAAVDIGGDKVSASFFSVADGRLAQDGPSVVRRATAGAGYLAVLEEVSQRAAAASTPLGISYAGPLDGFTIVSGMNLAVFIGEFQARYGGDFGRLNPKVTVVNDGEAGLLAAAMEAVRRHSGLRNVILVINGSGLNTAALIDGVVFTTEAGHVPVAAELNPLGQTKPCGMQGAQYVCLENVAASKAGIEDLWLRLRGEPAGGRQIAAAEAAGDELAAELYDGSALVTAHLVLGTACALGVRGDWSETAVVGHGGTFQVPRFRERVGRILASALSGQVQFFVTTDFSSNACIDGGAIAALSGMPATARPH
jgi:predicted NBD/HSP70 family sugar kinase